MEEKIYGDCAQVSENHCNAQTRVGRFKSPYVWKLAIDSRRVHVKVPQLQPEAAQKER